MVVARTLVDRAHADELRSACLAVALQLGGWDKRAVRRPGGLHRASPRSKTS
jgi:hypothetical protein